MEPCKSIEIPPCTSIVIMCGTRARADGDSVVIEHPRSMTINQLVGSQALNVAKRIDDEVAIFESEIATRQSAVPNRGEPSRGTPNRGEADRGR